MSRKIILDCDPGIDDAVAVTIALFDPRLDVLAITAAAGTVDAARATSNAAGIVAMLDPPRYPEIGRAVDPPDAPVLDDSHLNGPDGLGGLDLPEATRHNDHTSDKVIAEIVRRHPGEVTIVCLGPMTNLARMIRRDPTVLPLIDQIVIAGGSVSHPGDATAVAEMNCFFDPAAAKTVFASATTKSLVPLDITEQVTFGVDLVEQLPSAVTRAGTLLRKILPFAFRTAHRRLGREVIGLQDAVTIVAVTQPELFEWREMAGDVEVSGTIARGMTLFDRRLRPEWSTNLAVAQSVDVDQIRDEVLRGLRLAGQKTR